MTWSKHRNVLSIVSLVLLIWIFYSSALANGFVWDDNSYLTSTSLRNLHGLRSIWADPYATSHLYYPLTHSLMWLQYMAWGLKPLGYHIVCLVLHSINAILVLLVLKRLKVVWPWFCAAIFAIHPINVESVAWVAQTKTLLSALFYLLSLLMYFKFYPPREKLTPYRIQKRKIFYVMSGVFFALSLVSKSAFCTLPVAILIIYWWKNGRLSKQDVRFVAPFFFMAFLAAGFSLFLERTHVNARGPEFEFSLAERLLIASRTPWFYFYKIIFPRALIFNYERWPIDPGDITQYVYLLLFAALVILLWKKQNSWGRGPMAAVLFFVSNLFPILGLIHFYYMRYSFVADHYVYLAIISLSVLLSGGVHRYFSVFISRRILVMAMVLIIALLGMKTFSQSRAYKNLTVLYENILSQNPKSVLAYHNIGYEYDRQGRDALAMEMFEKTIELRPDLEEAYRSRAGVYFKRKQYDLAMQDYAKALQLRPFSFNAYVGMGNVYYDQGKTQKAHEMFDKALRINPRSISALNNKAAAYIQEKDYDAAMQLYQRALKFDPDNSSLYQHVGSLYVQLGEYSQAVRALTKAIVLDPNNAEAFNVRSLTLLKLNKAEAAFKDALAAQRLGKRGMDGYIKDVARLIKSQRSHEGKDGFGLEGKKKLSEDSWSGSNIMQDNGL